MPKNNTNVPIHNAIELTAIHGGIVIGSKDGKDYIVVTPELALELVKELPEMVKLSRRLPRAFAVESALDIAALMRQNRSVL